MINHELLAAIENNNAEQVRQLAASGVNIFDPKLLGISPWALILADERVEVARAYVELGADVNELISLPGEGTFTPLQLATIDTSVSVVELLLRAGADTNLTGKGDGAESVLAIANNWLKQRQRDAKKGKPKKQFAGLPQAPARTVESAEKIVQMIEAELARRSNS